MSARRAAACGSWASALSADAAAAAATAVGDCSIEGDTLLWTEARPAEAGRCVVVARSPDGTARDLTPAPFDVRSRVHEYGGRAYLASGRLLLFADDGDQRLYRADAGNAPRPITPDSGGALRYADPCLDNRRGLLWCVREDHRGAGEPRNTLVAVALAGDPIGGRVVVEGPDFVAAPRLSPDGTHLAWLAWHHPDMPWDGCELWLAQLDADGGLRDARRIAGSRDEAVQQPLWSPSGELYFVTDRSGWWNLARWRDGDVQPLAPMAAEFGEPMWNLGLATCAFAAPTQLVCVVTRDGRSTLACLDTATLQLRELTTPFTSFGSVAARNGQVLFTGASPRHAPSVGRLDLASGHVQVLREGRAPALDADDVSVAEAVEFPTSDGAVARGWFYAPRNHRFEPLPGERAPLLVLSHGGPTSRAVDAYRPAVQFWTTRGFGVLDVNYRGSSGYGRAYRQALDGRWGIADVDDCVNAALHLVERGDADRGRLIVRGGSAGGFTTLCALAFRDVFACGTSLYGIGDLETLAADTHKFESRYLDRLVGPYPAARATYRGRSPIHHLDGIGRPMLLMQGAEDRVVPPEQSRRMHAALKARGVPVAYLEFPGERHGFRDARNIARALRAEASFYARVFGFELADAAEPMVIDNFR